jgi:hypothetical protein
MCGIAGIIGKNIGKVYPNTKVFRLYLQTLVSIGFRDMV